MRISKRFLEDNKPTSEGTSRANHNENGCFGDSESVVIRMDSTGRVSAKCYRCGAWLVEESKTFHKAQQPSAVIKTNSPPSDLTSLWDATQEAKDWLGKAHMDLGFWNDTGLRWSSRKQALYIPAVNSYQRWWAVRHYAKDAKTRYTTLADRKDSCFGVCRAKDLRARHLYICEDLLSMYRLADAGADAMALCTTSINDKAVAMVARMGYNSVRLALDDDNRQVLLANHQIAKRLGFVKDVKTAGWGKDPKYFSRDELQEMIV